MNDSGAGNGEAAALKKNPLLSPKTLEDANTMFEKGSDAFRS